MKPVMHRAPWTQSDLKRMHYFARKGYSARATAAEIGRTVGATKYAGMINEISFHAINQKRGVQKKLARRNRRKAK